MDSCNFTCSNDFTMLVGVYYQVFSTKNGEPVLLCTCKIQTLKASGKKQTSSLTFRPKISQHNQKEKNRHQALLFALKYHNIIKRLLNKALK